MYASIHHESIPTIEVSKDFASKDQIDIGSWQLADNLLTWLFVQNTCEGLERIYICSQTKCIMF